ncbi:hypothetical protein MEG06_01075, partial [Vibrio aestuarianus]|nr:hypothetical protein [Vibrio aestuarianus]
GYVNYCQKVSAPRSQIIDNARFGKYLMVATGIDSGGRPTINGKRTSCYVVPNLEIMTEQFYQHYEMDT